MPEHGALIGGVVRQSALRTYDQCPARGIHEARTVEDWTSGPAALGTVFHAVMETILNRLRASGEERLPIEETLRIAREVASSPEAPHLSVDQLRDLGIITRQFSTCLWPARRILAVEKRMWADIRCPDGVVRTITGTPDVLIRDGSDGVLYIDAKVSWAVPKATPPDGDFSRDNGRAYLSERGTFQLDVGGLLIMMGRSVPEWREPELPGVNRTILREYYPRLNEQREAFLGRDELEHVEQRLGAIVQRFWQDMENPDPEPRAGSWCSHCDLKYVCKIPPEQRGEGMIRDPGEADRLAARFLVSSSEKAHLRAALKSYWDNAGYTPEVGKGHPEFPWLERQGGTESSYLRVGCPKCAAPAGEKCRPASGKGELKKIHRERWEQEAPV